jgi:hypothetical protein
MRWARIALAAVAWLFVVGVVVQVFLIGVALFGLGPIGFHQAFGYLLPLLTILVLLLLLPARPGWRIGWLAVALFVLGGIIQPSLPSFRYLGYPVIAALHPPNALLVFWLAVILARRATDVARGRAQAA